MSLIDLVPGGAQLRWGAIAGGAALAFVSGFAASGAYERTVPWGLGARLERLQKSLPGRDAERYSAGASAQRILDQRVVETEWRPALARCEADRHRLSEEAASSLSEQRDAARRTSDAAYRLGRASCTGAPNAESRVDRSAVGGSVHGSGEDLRSIVAAGVGATP